MAKRTDIKKILIIRDSEILKKAQEKQVKEPRTHPKRSRFILRTVLSISFL